MLDRKHLPYRYVELVGGMHPPSLRALGFRGVTVPAMKLPDGRRVQGSLEIAHALRQLVPAPSRYPVEPAARQEAEAAERWGESTLQPVPRRLIRWGLSHRSHQRRWFADVASPLPAPAVTAVMMSPLAPVFARQVGASDEQVRQDLAELPSLLDEVDRLLDRGVIGGEELGAADLQSGATVRMLLTMEDVGQLVKKRTAKAFARWTVSDYPEIPAVFPSEWLVATTGATKSSS